MPTPRCTQHHACADENCGCCYPKGPIPPKKIDATDEPEVWRGFIE